MKPIESFKRKIKIRIFGKERVLNKNIPKIFYCHVPKSAGTAVSKQIWNQMYRNQGVKAFSIDLYASKKASQIFSVDMMEAREHVLAYNLSNPSIYYGTGHVRCHPKLVAAFANEWNFITILRNPVDRWISEYIYNTYKNIDWEKNSLPIDDYLFTKKARDTAISFIRFFSSMPIDYVGDYNEFIDEAVGNLGRFSVVGIVENLDNWCNSFEKYFNQNITIPRSNISPNIEAANKIRTNPGIMGKIEMLCEPDTRVYQRMVNNLNEKISEVPE